MLCNSSDRSRKSARLQPCVCPFSRSFRSLCWHSLCWPAPENYLQSPAGISKCTMDSSWIGSSQTLPHAITAAQARTASISAVNACLMEAAKDAALATSALCLPPSSNAEWMGRPVKRARRPRRIPATRVAATAESFPGRGHAPLTRYASLVPAFKRGAMLSVNEPPALLANRTNRT